MMGTAQFPLWLRSLGSVMDVAQSLYLSLSFYLPLSVTHTQAGLSGWESLTALCTLVCGRQSIHYVCPTHSLYMGQCHMHTYTLVHMQTNAKRDTCMHTQSGPQTPKAFSQMPGKLPQGLSHTHTHTLLSDIVFPSEPWHSVAVQTPCSFSFSFQIKRYEGGGCEI